MSYKVLNGVLIDVENCKEFTIPGDVKSIDESAFIKCKDLEVLTISSSLDCINIEVFAYCNSLREIYVVEENTSYCAVDGILYSKDMTKMYFVPHQYKVDTLIVLDSVTDICNSLVYNYNVEHIVLSKNIEVVKNIGGYNNSTRVITIPASITNIEVTKNEVSYMIGEIGSAAFVYAKEHDILFIDMTKLESNDIEVLKNYRLKELENGYEIEEFIGVQETDTMIIPSTFKGKSIVSIANKGCSLDNVKKKYEGNIHIWIPDSVETIGEDAFSWTGANSIHLPKQLKTLGKNALRHLNHRDVVIEKLVIPNHVKAIEEGALEGLYVERLYVPSSVEFIHDKWFGNYDFYLDDLQVIVEENSYAEEFFKQKNRLTMLYTTTSDYEAMFLRSFKMKKEDDGINLTHASEYYHVVNYLDRNTITELVVPETLQNVPVTSFSMTYTYFPNLKKLVLPKTLKNTVIFYKDKYPSLEEVVIDEENTYLTVKDGVIYSKDYTRVFVGFGRNEKVDLHPNVQVIEENAFYYNRYIREVVFPSSVVSIGKYAFMNTTLKEITFTSDIEKLEERAFYGCEELEFVNSVDKVRFVEKEVFDKTKYHEILLNSQEYVIIGGSLVRYNGNGKNPVIPSSVKTIASTAFSSNQKITELVIPSTVCEIEYKAFNKMSKLKSIVFEENHNIEKLNLNLFDKCNSLETITLHEGLIRFELTDFMEATSLKTLYVSSTVKELENLSVLKNEKYAFRAQLQFDVVISEDNPYYQKIDNIIYSKDLKTLIRVLPSYGDTLHILDGVTTIGEYACCELCQITSVVMPDTVTTIGKYAFKSCVSLNSVKLSANLVSVEDYAFERCPLASIELPKSVQEIGNNIFHGCSSITVYDNIEPNAMEYTEKTDTYNSRYKCNLATIGSCFDYYKHTWNNHEIIVKSVETDEVKFKVYMGADGEKRDLCTTLSGCWGRNATFNFELADSMFSSMPASEKCTYVCYRLKYPIDLSEENKTKFVAYLVRSAKDFVRSQIDNNNVNEIIYFEPYGILKKNNIEELIQYAQKFNKTECVAYLMDYQNEKFGQKKTRTSLGSMPKAKKEVDKNSVAYLKKIWMVKELDNGYGLISRYKGDETDIIFPTQIGDIKIVGIADRGGNPPEIYKQLKSVVIPDGYTIIGNLAFEGCSALESIEIPTTVLSMGDKAFWGCNALKEFVLTNNMNESYNAIGKWMLRGCTSLKDLYVLHEVNNFNDTNFLRDCNNYTIYASETAKIREYLNRSKKIQLLEKSHLEYLAKKYYTKPVVRYVNTKMELTIGEQLDVFNQNSDYDMIPLVMNKEGKILGELYFNGLNNYRYMTKINDKAVLSFVDYITVTVVDYKDNVATLEIQYNSEEK